MADAYAQVAPSLCEPPSNGLAVTADDEVIFEQPTRMLWIGEAGDVTVRLMGGSQVNFVDCRAGSLLPARVDKVFATGTTAGSILGLW